jgi:IS6 family transposase
MRATVILERIGRPYFIRMFFSHALTYGPSPTEVNTDRAPIYPRVLDELLPAACHITEQDTNNSIEADHGRLKSRLRPVRGLTGFAQHE